MGGKKRKREDEQNRMDLLSKLPEDVIQYILRFLPLEEANRKAILLCKSWYRAWSTFTRFSFDDLNFREKSKFMDFIDNSLQRCVEQNLCIEKFGLKMRLAGYHGLNLNFIISQWLRIASERRIMELDLSFHGHWGHGNDAFRLPDFVFSIRTIKILKLYGCRLESSCCVSLAGLNHLKELYLEKVSVSGKILEYFASKIPNLEVLIVKKGRNSGTVNISSPKLRILVLRRVGFVLNTIVASSLEELLVRQGSMRKPIVVENGIDSVALPCLLKLTLERVHIRAQSVEKLVSKCPLLNHLVLKDCNGFGETNKIEIKGATNLEAFVYHGSNWKLKCEIILRACPILKEVNLKGLTTTKQQLQDLLKMTPTLEVLMIEDCDTRGSISIWMPKAREIVLKRVVFGIDSIFAPNLNKLVYKDNQGKTWCKYWNRYRHGLLRIPKFIHRKFKRH